MSDAVLNYHLMHPGGMRSIAGDPSFTDVLAKHRAILADWVRLFQDKAGEGFVKIAVKEGV